MNRGRFAAAFALIFAAFAGVESCTDIPTSDTAVLSLAFDSLPAPAVVVRDTLRDSSGKAVAIHASVYNFKGEAIGSAPVRFGALDPGIHVDPATGFVIGDSITQRAPRLVVTVGSLQAVKTLEVTLRPDTTFAVNGRDSLSYSLLDSTKNFSPDLSVRVLHSLTSPDSVVKSYVVSFAVVSPADTLVARLVNESNRASRLDTTDATGLAARRIHLNPTRLTALTDSIIVNATVRYRGAQVRGSPVRLVLKVKPGA